MEREKVAIYCRLSKEDMDKGQDEQESESIINQKNLLLQYAYEKDYDIHDIYIDDDYSGMYNDRPEFKRLMGDALERKFHIILAKTQSRFTRSMEHVEKYLHHDFQRLGIRFIGVVDGVDTADKNNKKTRQINGLVNEWYCEDLSNSIKAVFYQKMKEGQFLGSFACYGYSCDPIDRHKLIIDEEAAEVVRMIFNLYNMGYGTGVIAQKLTEKKIPTPTLYKRQKGYRYHNPNAKNNSSEGTWSVTTIKRILSNRMYIGTLIQGREKKESYKSKKVILAPENEWIVQEHNHESIISEDLFNKTQELLKNRRKSCRPVAGQKPMPHIFSGKIKCLDCKSSMVKTTGKKSGGYDYFVCSLSRRTKQTQCTRHSIRYDILKEHLEQGLRSILIKYYSEEYIQNKIQQESISKKLTAIRIKLKRIKEIQENLRKAMADAYLDKVNKILTIEEFLLIKNQISHEIKKQEQLHTGLSTEMEFLERKENDQGAYYYEVITNMKLSLEVMNDIIDSIYIGEKKEGTQEIVVKWKF